MLWDHIPGYIFGVPPMMMMIDDDDDDDDGKMLEHLEKI